MAVNDPTQVAPVQQVAPQGPVQVQASATAPTAPQAAAAVQDVVGNVDFTGAPPAVRWGASLAVLGAELAIVVYLVVMAYSFGNADAKAALPIALALFGAHQAISPSGAIAGR